MSSARTPRRWGWGTPLKKTTERSTSSKIVESPRRTASTFLHSGHEGLVLPINLVLLLVLDLVTLLRTFSAALHEIVLENPTHFRSLTPPEPPVRPNNRARLWRA